MLAMVVRDASSGSVQRDAVLSAHRSAMQERLHSIDHLRVYAAITVLFGHAVHAVVETGDFPAARLEFYRQGVGSVVFLTIAAFIAAHTGGDRGGEPGAGRRYLMARLLRIVPLYWAFTTLFVAVAWLMPALVDHGGLSPRHALSSYLFVPAPRPTDGRLRPLLNPGWTLNYIVWFHALVALCLCAPRRMGLWPGAAALVAVAMVGMAWRPSGVVGFFTAPYMLALAAGIGCCWLRSRLAARVALPILLSVGTIAGLFLWSWSASVAEGDAVSVAFAALIVLVASLTRDFGSGSRVGALWRTLAEASYSIYLSQAFSLAGSALVLHRLRLLRPLGLWGGIAAVSVVALVAGVLVHRTLERPLTQALRRFGPQPRAALPHVRPAKAS